MEQGREHVLRVRRPGIEGKVPDTAKFGERQGVYLVDVLKWDHENHTMIDNRRSLPKLTETDFAAEVYAVPHAGRRCGPPWDNQ